MGWQKVTRLGGRDCQGGCRVFHGVEGGRLWARVRREQRKVWNEECGQVEGAVDGVRMRSRVSKKELR